MSIYDNCACALAETLKLRFRAIFKVIIFHPRVHARRVAEVFGGVFVLTGIFIKWGF